MRTARLLGTASAAAAGGLLNLLFDFFLYSCSCLIRFFLCLCLHSFGGLFLYFLYGFFCPFRCLINCFFSATCAGGSASATGSVSVWQG